MKIYTVILTGVLLLLGVAQAAKDNLLATLRPEHPRLMLTRADWDALRDRTQREPLAQTMLKDLCRQGDKELTSNPVKHELIGPRLLDKSRTALDRITLLAGLYRLTGNTDYTVRARREMLTVVEFKDWNPSHFLDVAEMTTALGLGYDWLYDVLPLDERKAIKQAIVEKGLKPGLGETPGAGSRFWLKTNYNWNQVCNGGLGIGALAIADEEPELAARILRQSLDALPRALASYSPDGGWAEGPGYWEYATHYTANIICALESALGKDFGLKAIAGLERAGFFHIYSTSPQGLAFNFADAHEGSGASPTMFWLARTFRQPVFAAHNFFCEKKFKTTPFFLYWLPVSVPNAALVTQLPASAWFKGVNVALLRSDWNTKATFIGFKGGDNAANHSHLDLGTFVLDMNGLRWCEDLGSDNYNLPGYFDIKKQRWSYYRMKTEGHNCITLGGSNQNYSAKAPIIAFDGTPGRACAVADLTAGYTPRAQRIQRGVMLLGEAGALIQDEVSLEKPAELIWAVHTPATITINGSEALLKQKGQTVVVRIIEPKNAQFELMPLPKVPESGRLLHTKKFGVRLAATKTTRLIVLFSPTSTSANLQPPLRPLSAWAKPLP